MENDYKDLDIEAQRAYIIDHLSEENKATFETLPDGVARQLSLDRDPQEMFKFRSLRQKDLFLIWLK